MLVCHKCLFLWTELSSGRVLEKEHFVIWSYFSLNSSCDVFFSVRFPSLLKEQQTAGCFHWWWMWSYMSLFNGLSLNYFSEFLHNKDRLIGFRSVVYFPDCWS